MQSGSRSYGREAAVAAALFAVVAGHGVLRSLVHPGFSPDAAEHLAIANSWVHGAGFVDPVVWFFFLDEGPPLPGPAVRAPVISVLAAAPLALGASITGVTVLHAVWSGLVAALTLLLACRWMTLPAALGAALLLFLSKSWQLVTRIVWTEVSGVAALLAVVASARWVQRSVPGALVCCAATVLAGLTRPQMSALYLAVLVAAIWELGWRDALRRPPLLAYLVGFPLLWLAVRWVVEASTGLPLYAAYGGVGQFFSDKELMAYAKLYPGRGAFVTVHAAEILEIVGKRCVQLLRAVCFEPDFLYAGWLVPLAVGGGLVRRSDGVWEHRILALCTLGFTGVVIFNYSAFDAKRYPLFVAVPAVLGAFAALDHGLRVWGRRGTVRGRGWLPWLLPAAALLVFVGANGAATVAQAEISWKRLLRQGPFRMARSPVLNAGEIRAICPHVDRDAHVAVAYPFPWAFAFWCGNATSILPSDVLKPGVLGRFLRERRPRYIVVPKTGRLERLHRRRNLEWIGGTSSFQVYEVADARPRPEPWKAPPPPACAGEGPDCGLRRGDRAPWRAATGRGQDRLPPAPHSER
jgi:hypothetical protein